MFSFYKITITDSGSFEVGNYENFWKLFGGFLFGPLYEFCAAIKINSPKILQTVNWISSMAHDEMRVTGPVFFWSTHGWQVARCFSLLVDECTGAQSSAIHVEFWILAVSLSVFILKYLYLDSFRSLDFCMLLALWPQSFNSTNVNKWSFTPWFCCNKFYLYLSLGFCWQKPLNSQLLFFFFVWPNY